MDIARSHPAPENADWFLAEARRALTAGDNQEAEQSFLKLLHTALEAEGFYGLGFISLSEDHPEAAKKYFQRAVAFDPGHANSQFHLGAIAEREGRPAEAVGRFQLAVDARPGHGGAQAGLKRLGAVGSPAATLPSDPASRWELRSLAPGSDARDRMAPAPVLDEAEDIDARFGVYEYLLRDRSILARQAVAILSRLRIDRPPTLLSFFGFAGPSAKGARKAGLWVIGFVVFAIAAVIVGLGFLQVLTPAGRGTSTAGDLLARAPTLLILAGLRALIPILIILAILIPISRFLRHVTTRIQIERGRLQLERGLITRNLHSLELWRVQNIELQRRGLHRLTGDGTLIFHAVGGSEPISVTGIARGSSLIELHRDLLDLVFLLRTNPSIKGIVQ